MKRVERIRLYPTPVQARALRFMLDVTRELYNAALQERRDAYRLRGISISAKQQYAELTALRKSATRLDTRLAAVYRECEDAALRRLHLAMQAFFRRCKRGEAPGFPRFKARDRWHQITFPHGGRALSFDATQQRVTVLGVDRGVHVLAATSDGALIPNLAAGERRRAATRRLQRDLDAASVYAGTERNRRCLNRRDPKRIVESTAVVALEGLRLRHMTRTAKGSTERPGRNVAAKAGLNRVVLDAGFGLLEQMIVAKAEEAGRRIVQVNPRFSSQECSHCGHVASESRRKRRFRCVACRFTCHADVNAALVIRRRGQSALMSERTPAEDAGRRARRAA